MIVLHISKTPLAGSPARISSAINNFSDLESYHFFECDYPGNLKGLMSNESICISEGNKSEWMFDNVLKSADIIHVHNEVSLDVSKKIIACKPECKFIYHVHSPLREGPLFVELVSKMGIEFNIKLVVAQYQARIYQDYIPVLNLVPYKPYIKEVKPGDIPRVICSPAHKRVGGRWNDKTSKALDLALRSLSKFKKIELIECAGVKPFELFSLRKKCHITIDEIKTGSFHQVSLEGLAAGNAVINNSDWFSDLYLKKWSNYEVDLPFIKADCDSIYDVLVDFQSDYEKLRKKQIESFEFFNKFLLPEYIVKSYLNIYKRLVNV